MFINLPQLPRVLAASKLSTAATNAKWLPPPAHSTPMRRLFIRSVPSEKVFSPNTWTLQTIIPGHVDLLFTPADIDVARSLKNRPDSWARLLKLFTDPPQPAAAAKTGVPLGLAADPGGRVFRAWRVKSDRGFEYTNVEIQSKPLNSPHDKTDSPKAKALDLGNLGEGHWRAIFQMLESRGEKPWSLAGTTPAAPKAPEGEQVTR